MKSFLQNQPARIKMDNKDLIKEIENHIYNHEKALMPHWRKTNAESLLLLRKCKVALQSQAIAPIRPDEKFIKTENQMLENYAKNALEQYKCSIDELELVRQDNSEGCIWIFRKRQQPAASADGRGEV